MIVSDARREANRRNALKSTGPKTDAGKEAVRRNALKHGLTAVVVAVEDEEAAVAGRLPGVEEMLRPRNSWQAWVVEEIARVSVRLDRLGRVERQVRAEGAWRALSFWEDDQRQEVERVAARLAGNPGKVVGWLRRSPRGCDWLIERWAMLASVADRHPWTDDQKRLAYDLLRTPLEVREDAPGRMIDAEGFGVGPDRSEAEVARGAVADLEAQRDRVIEADEVARSLAQADLNDLGNRDLVRLRRYEQTLRAQLRWYFDLARHQSPQAVPDLDRKPHLARLADRFPDVAKAAPVAIPIEIEKDETKPLAPVAEVQNKAISSTPSDETKPLSPLEPPALADPRPPAPVSARPSRPWTAYEQWSWERAEADRIRLGQVRGANERFSTLAITAGRRPTNNLDLPGSSLVGQCRGG